MSQPEPPLPTLNYSWLPHVELKEPPSLTPPRDTVRTHQANQRSCDAIAPIHSSPAAASPDYVCQDTARVRRRYLYTCAVRSRRQFPSGSDLLTMARATRIKNKSAGIALQLIESMIRLLQCNCRREGDLRHDLCCLQECFQR